MQTQVTLRSIGSDILKSFLSKVAFESNLRKKLARIHRTCSNRDSFFRKKKNGESFHDTRARFLSKVTFESNFRKKTFQCVTTLTSGLASSYMAICLRNNGLPENYKTPQTVAKHRQTLQTRWKMLKGIRHNGTEPFSLPGQFAPRRGVKWVGFNFPLNTL